MDYATEQATVDSMSDHGGGRREFHVDDVAASQPAECPFVNRSDGRCAEHLTVGGMGYAYDHCFDNFHACPVHAELIAEQNAREAHFPEFATIEFPSDFARGSGTPAASEGKGRWKRIRSKLVQLTVRRNKLNHAA